MSLPYSKEGGEDLIPENIYEITCAATSAFFYQLEVHMGPRQAEIIANLRAFSDSAVHAVYAVRNSHAYSNNKDLLSNIDNAVYQMLDFQKSLITCNYRHDLKHFFTDTYHENYKPDCISLAVPLLKRKPAPSNADEYVILCSYLVAILSFAPPTTRPKF